MTNCFAESDFMVDQIDRNLLDYAVENAEELYKEHRLLELRTLILERGECNEYTFEDNFLLRFLRARDFVVRHAHRLLANYCRFKSNNIEYYGNIRTDSIEDTEIIRVQPHCDASNRRIFIYKLGNWNIQRFTFNELVQHTILALELFILEPRTQILGGICIFDLDGIKKRHLKFITLKFISQMLDVLLWSFPIRIHAVHIVNDTDATDFDFSIIRLFMNSEARRKILSHGTNLKSLHRYIDPKYLPEQYGGHQPQLNYGKWLSDLVRTDFKALEELNKIGYQFIQ